MGPRWLCSGVAALSSVSMLNVLVVGGGYTCFGIYEGFLSVYVRDDTFSPTCVKEEKQKKKQLLHTLCMPEHTLISCNKLGVKRD